MFQAIWRKCAQYSARLYGIDFCEFIFTKTMSYLDLLDTSPSMSEDPRGSRVWGYML